MTGSPVTLGLLEGPGPTTKQGGVLPVIHRENAALCLLVCADPALQRVGDGCWLGQIVKWKVLVTQRQSHQPIER